MSAITFCRKYDEKLCRVLLPSNEGFSLACRGINEELAGGEVGRRQAYLLIPRELEDSHGHGLALPTTYGPPAALFSNGNKKCPFLASPQLVIFAFNTSPLLSQHIPLRCRIKLPLMGPQLGSIKLN